jgi:transmembrane secretion effector
VKKSPSLFEPLRLRNFRVLWTGMTISLVGDGVMLVALAWQMYTLSNSPGALAAVGVAMSIPHVVLALFGGVVSDRFDRRRVMIAADAVRGLALMTLAAPSIAGGLHTWQVMLVAALYGAGSAFFGPAFDAIVPDLVPDALLTQANSLDQLARPAALRLVGPALGGVVVAVAGAGWAFLLDGATFAVSIACLYGMQAGERANRAAGQPASTFEQLREGFRFVRSRVWLWGTLASSSIACLLFLGPSEVLLPFVVKRELHAGAGALGIVLATGGVGAMTASILLGRRGLPRRHITFMYVAWMLSTAAIASYGLARFPWQLMAACFMFNAFESAGLIVWATLRQRLVPRHLLGRVSSLDWSIATGLMPVSFALVGPAVVAFGPRATLVGAGVLGSLVTGAAYFLPGMRDPEALDGGCETGGDGGRDPGGMQRESVSIADGGRILAG